MPKVNTGEVDLYYEYVGTGDECIVLLNGVMMSTDAWGYQTPVLSKHYKVLLNDFRGQGRSSKPDHPYTFDMHATDLKFLLDELGIKKAHFVGTSYGAEVGMHFAIKYPEYVKSLTAATAVSESDYLLKQKIESWCIAARHALELGKSAKYDFFLLSAPYNFSTSFLATHPTFLEEKAKEVAKLPDEWFRAFIRLCECFKSLDITDQLHKIKARTLIISAENDTLKSVRYSAIMAKQISKSESVIVMEAGHSMVIESSSEFLTCLMGFINKLE